MKLIMVYKPEHSLITGFEDHCQRVFKEHGIISMDSKSLLLTPYFVKQLYHQDFIEYQDYQIEFGRYVQFLKGPSKVIWVETDLDFTNLRKKVIGSLNSMTGIRGFVEQNRSDRFWRKISGYKPEKFSSLWWRYNAIHCADSEEERVHDLSIFSNC